MTWVGATSFARRPLAVVEDHLHHVTEILAALASEDPDLLAQTTVLCLDRPGPDTDAAVARWLALHPTVQIAACATGPADPRFLHLDPEIYTSANHLARAVAATLRPSGLLLQDVQLSTLRFVPAERWWESIYLASTVRGMFPTSPPSCRFLSNKRGYEATFGRDLSEAGFDPRDVMDKRELQTVVAPVVHSHLDRAFPLLLETAQALPAAVARTEDDRREIETHLDLLLWLTETTVELAGRLLDRTVVLKAGSQEATTWQSLLADRLAQNTGLPVLTLGARVAPPGAGRPEQTNLAARHIHALRARLADPTAIRTESHAYRLQDSLRLGRIRPR